MARVGRYANAAMVLQWPPDELPPGSTAESLVRATPDRASTSGTLYRPAGDGARGVVSIMHPRVDCTHHYLVPGLLRAGWAVWIQRSRWVNNDLTLVHERVLIDVAVAQEHLRGRGYERFYLLGNSGGASLYALYTQQAHRPAEERLRDDPAGTPIDLSLPMPTPSGLVLLAPHPGQGDLLRHSIDPSVTDESDGASVDPSLDMYDPRNGFAEPPQPSSYSLEFLERYRSAQLERVRRIDGSARELLRLRKEARARAKEDGGVTDRRRSLVPNFLTVYRTDADPRTTDLSLDPSARDYGSIFGVRPDVTNYGATGFGRLSTPEAWLSTWSANSTRAALRLTAPDISLPVLVINYTADNSVFPSDVRGIFDDLGSDDKSFLDVDGDHYGLGPGSEERRGGRRACEAIVDWLAGR